MIRWSNSRFRSTLIWLSIALMVALLLWQVSGQVWIGWLGINIVTLAVYRYDKAIANTDRRRRLPELTLLALAYAGGAAGALLGMTIRPRHKTSKPAFYLQVWLALAIHLLLWVGYAVLW